MEEPNGSGALSNSSGGFQVGTLGRCSDTTSAPVTSAEVFLCTPLAIFAPFWGLSSLEGKTSPYSDPFLPFLSLFRFLSACSKGEV